MSEHGTNDRDPIEDALRASLAAHAHDAPASDGVVSRVLADVGATPTDELARQRSRRQRRRQLRTWSLPVLAAGAVAAAIVGTVVGLQPSHPSAVPPAMHSTAPVTTTLPTPTGATTPSPTTMPVNTGSLHQLHLMDLTFVSATDGWALGVSDCLHTSGRCTALLRTTDGSHWKPINDIAFNVPGVSVGCTNYCVQHIRFANDQIGYAYGPNALFMTTNGGKRWTELPGMSAFALETLRGNVILATNYGGDTLVESAPIGTTGFTKATLPLGATGNISGAWMGRIASNVVIGLSDFNPAHPAHGDTIIRSSDNGATWQLTRDPCHPLGGGVYSEVTGISLAPGGEVALACTVTTPAGTPKLTQVVTSTDGGRSFSAPSSGTLTAPVQHLVAVSKNLLIASTANGAYRSTDGGNNWSLISGVSGTVTFIGFESLDVGRIVAGDGTAIYTTNDAGTTWTRGTFG